jgi:competence protein ComEC
MRIPLPLVSLIVCAILIAGCTAPPAGPGPAPTVQATAAPAETASVTAPTAAVSASPTPPPTFPAGARTLRVSVLDVGQGDAVLVQSPNGRTMLVDAGDADAGPAVVAALRERDIGVLDAAVATHAHADHIGGFGAVFARFPVGRFYDAGYPSTSATYEEMLTTIDEQDYQYRTPTQGETIDLDPAVRIDVLAPDGQNAGEIHDNMLVLRLSYGRTSFLLAGDMSAGLERELVSTGATVESTVLKVAHHGSRSSSTAAFLAAVDPEVAVISVGGENPYGHPTGEVLLRLAAVNATVYETGQSGTVTVSSDGARVTVATERIAPSALPLVLPTFAATRPRSTAKPTVAAPGPVAITSLNLRGETVTVTNRGPTPANLTGWRLTDEGPNHVYTFAGTTLPAGGSVTLATGTATGEIRWKSDNVWNNDGDTAYLYDAAGRLVSTREGGP